MASEQRTTDSSGATKWRPPAKFWPVYVSLILAMFLSALDQTIVATALPTVVGELGNLSLMAWVITAYTVAMTVTMVIWGKFGDLMGRRELFLVALGIFAVGSALCGLSQSVGQLIAFRAVQGLGGGGLMVLSQAILADLLPPRERPRYMAPLGALFGLASVIGPLLGGFITDHWSWQWIFWINLPLGGLALAVSFKFLRLGKPDIAFRTDFGGIVSVSVAVVALTLLVSWGGTTYSWTSLPILGLAAVVVLAVAAFVLSERKATDAIIPLHFFANPSFSIPTALGVLAALGMFAAVSYIPTYLQMVYGLGATLSGFLVLPLIAGTMVTSILSGAIITRSGQYRMFPPLGMGLMGVAFALLSTMTSQTSLWLVGAYLGLLGLGLGCVLQVLVLIVQNEVRRAELGTATSSNNFFREIGATMGIAVVGGLFTSGLLGKLQSLDLAGLVGSIEELTPALVAALPAAQQAVVIEAYASSLVPLFGYLVPLFVAGFVLALLMPKGEMQAGAEVVGH